AFDNCDVPADPDLVDPDTSLVITQLIGMHGGIDFADYTPGTVIPVGMWNIGYVVEDTDGNMDTCAFRITVWDTQDPILMAGIPEDEVLSCEEVWDTFHLLPRHVMDNCVPSELLTIEEYIISDRVLDPADCGYYSYHDTIFWTVTDSVQVLP